MTVKPCLQDRCDKEGRIAVVFNSMRPLCGDSGEWCMQNRCQCCRQRGEGRETRLGVRDRLVSRPGHHRKHLLDYQWRAFPSPGALGRSMSSGQKPTLGYFSDIIIAMPTSFSLFLAWCVFSVPFLSNRLYILSYIILC